MKGGQLKNHNGFYYYVILSSSLKTKLEAAYFEICMMIDNRIRKDRLLRLRVNNEYRIVRKLYREEIMKPVGTQLDGVTAKVFDYEWEQGAIRHTKRVQRWLTLKGTKMWTLEELEESCN